MRERDTTRKAARPARTTKEQRPRVSRLGSCQEPLKKKAASPQLRQTAAASGVTACIH